MHVPLAEDMVIRCEHEPHAIGILRDILSVGIPRDDCITLLGLDIGICINVRVSHVGLVTIGCDKEDIRTGSHSSDKFNEILNLCPLDCIVDLGRVHAFCLGRIPEIELDQKSLPDTYSG